ncbi:MAG: hypothetical protein PF637_14720 [Spirochaetes bacterium]|jgi:hypothetical protein|nr:hypothetical protein [Spirochaetota bacterium]
MLNFFMILLTNIFTGVILYLVLTLKLEKSSTNYHIQKYKREIEEMMREFNQSAERNITLLENRIKMCKKLLKISGSIESIDIRSIDAAQVKPETPSVDIGVSVAEDYSLVREMKTSGVNSDKSSHSYLVDDDLDLEPGRVEDEMPDPETQLREGGNQHETFVSLYRQGFSPEIISEASDVTLPEVLLILQLNGIELNENGEIHGF